MGNTGLYIKNKLSDVQVDGTYINMFLQERGEDSIPGGKIVYPSVSLQHPLVILSPDTDFFVSEVGQKYVDPYCTEIWISTEEGQTTTVKWAAYDTYYKSSSSAEYGLRVFNSRGEEVFLSSRSFFNIKHVATVSLANPSATFDYSDISHPVIGCPYYFISPRSLAILQTVPTGPGLYLYKRCCVGVKKLSSSSVRVGWYSPTSWAQTSMGSLFYNPQITVFVCEVK